MRAGDVIRFYVMFGQHNFIDTTGGVETSCGMPTTALYYSGDPQGSGTSYYVSTAGLMPGTYTFVCPVHCFLNMRGTFIVNGECTGSKSGDVSGDGRVDLLDAVSVVDRWGPCRAGDCVARDLNYDGVVNRTDLQILISNWTFV